MYANAWHGGFEPTAQRLQAALEKNAKYCCTSAKCFKRTGYDIELFTDKRGLELIKDNNVFNNINTDLEDLSEESPVFWSLPKIFSLNKALDKSEGPVIHIDSDIFFHNANLIKERVSSDWDIFVQSKEYLTYFKENYKISIDLFINIFLGLYPMEKNTFNFFKIYFEYSYNCGFLGFKNKDIGTGYFNKYYEIYKKASNPQFLETYLSSSYYDFPHLYHRHNAENFILRTKNFKLNLNCILEQIQLVNFSNYYNLHAKELIPISEWDLSNLNEGCVKNNQKLGYTHLSGNSKYNIDKIYNKIISEYDIY